jgi:tetratricopeptide (TPR) repeat protein
MNCRYTDEPFIYTTLNRALRTRNIELILFFGFFIRDLNEKLQLLSHQQSKTIMKVYRGQWMSKTEVNQIRTSINKLISINSFFSTSLNSNVASLFLDNTISSDDRQRVLFEMEVDRHLLNTKPFANISSISSYADEEEILFMTNSIFRVQSVDQNDNQQVIIRLTLCNENEHDLKDVYAHLCNDQNEGSLTLADVLLDMGQLIEADRYCARILTQLQPSQLSTYHNQRGVIAGELGDHQLSIEYFETALSKTNQADVLGYAQIIHNMGIAYDQLNNSTLALYCFSETLKRYQSLKDPKYYSDTARCFNSIGSLYADQNEYEEAIKNFTTALKIQRKFCRYNYSDLALSYMNICNAYADLGQHTKVIEYYDQALELYKDSIPHEHADFRQLYHNMTRTFEEMKNYSRAIAALEKIRSIYLETLPLTDSRILDVEKDIIRLKQKESQVIHEQ